MNVKSRINNLEKVNQEARKVSVLCFTDRQAGTIDIREPINFKGSIEEGQRLIDRKGFSAINIIDDIMQD